MNALLDKIRTARKLGLGNILTVARYRLLLKAGLHPVQKLSPAKTAGPYFNASALPSTHLAPVRDWSKTALLFGYREMDISDPPAWFQNPLTKAIYPRSTTIWHQLPDFDPDFGDIKLVWELSRMDWVVALAQSVRNGDAAALERLNCWIEDWCDKNPPYVGPNWKCAQEASIRVIHIIAAVLITGCEEDPLPGLCDLVETHLQRIFPTLSYAQAQQNNHATSEAAALFIGGLFLEKCKREGAGKYKKSGRAYLEKLTARLFSKDGTFSQYSANYHRFALTTLSIVEASRIRFGAPPFSPEFYQRASAATGWLQAIIDKDSGDVPVLGANDGANLLQMETSEYRDYRPALKFASALFLNCRWMGQVSDTLTWLSLPQPPKECSKDAVSLHFPEGGMTVLRNATSMALLRHPNFIFRPSHADFLHLDFWSHGQNLLHDDGTFSYADETALQEFGQISSHNSIQFDGLEPMPRLGRFLYGCWTNAVVPSPPHFSSDGGEVSAYYTDRQAHKHSRTVTLHDNVLTVCDKIDGTFDKAVLRWRLSPSDWKIDGNIISDGKDSITIEAQSPVKDISLKDGVQSRYYYHKHSIPVLEITIDNPGIITTIYRAFS